MSHSFTRVKKKDTILKDNGKSLAVCQDYENQSKSEVPNAPEALRELELVLLLVAGTDGPSASAGELENTSMGSRPTAENINTQAFKGLKSDQE